MNYSLPGSSVCGILQSRILEWVAMPSSRGSSPPRDQTHISCISWQILYHWATREAFSKRIIMRRLNDTSKEIWKYVLHRKIWSLLLLSSVQFSGSVVSDSLWPHELQHARPPCPSPTLEVHSDSCPSIQWCHPAISSSVIPFSSCPQTLPASESFPMSQLFAWSGQSTWVSALVSLLVYCCCYY